MLFIKINTKILKILNYLSELVNFGVGQFLSWASQETWPLRSFCQFRNLLVLMFFLNQEMNLGQTPNHHRTKPNPIVLI